MDRLLRYMALALSGATLVWLSGCGGPGGEKPAGKAGGIAAEIAQREAKADAAKAKAAEAEAAAAAAQQQAMDAEEPSAVTRDDYKKGSIAKQGGAIAQAIGGVRAAGEDVQLKNILRQVEIQAQIDGYPKSHEAFMALMDKWGMELPELAPPYEYWWDADAKELKKRTKPPAADSE
ncbi:MAG: hypothetical protein AAF790_11000 [Planctomycetota bacterium]